MVNIFEYNEFELLTFFIYVEKILKNFVAFDVNNAPNFINNLGYEVKLKATDFNQKFIKKIEFDFPQIIQNFNYWRNSEFFKKFKEIEITERELNMKFKEFNMVLIIFLIKENRKKISKF